MFNHRYILEKGSQKHICPGCGKKRFVRYIDEVDRVYLPQVYGRCDRESSCAYHLNPYLDGYLKSVTQLTKSYNSINGCNEMSRTKSLIIYKSDSSRTKQISYIPYEDVKLSRTHYHKNNFTLWLTSFIGTTITSQVISKYHIGTSKHWPGATIFWQIDQHGKVRSGKIMLYNVSSGHRVKNPYPHITWVHKQLQIESFELEQCFFGEHLLNLYPDNPVGIVESEKTAIIASVYLPNLVWLAAGSLSNLSIQKFKVLKGRKVFLFPDLNGYRKWNEKANEIRLGLPGIHLLLSDLMEKSSSQLDKISGLDLADYLMKYDWHQFSSTIRKVPNSNHSELYQTHHNSTFDLNPSVINEASKIISRNFPINEAQLWPVSDLVQFFKEFPFPEGNIKLEEAMTITNINQFIESHLETIKAQNGNSTYLPYFDRLNKFKEYIQSQHN
jgi:hypothetical protein